MQRNPAIDAYRGIGISLVVLGHVKGLPSDIWKLIYAFHMPAFFILSGWLYNPEKLNSDMGGYIVSKFSRFIIPAWTIGLICGVPFIFLMFFGAISLDEFMHRLYGTFTGVPRAESNFHCTPIWFLFCLFVVDIAVYFGFKAFRERKIIFLGLLIFFGIISIGISEHVPEVPFAVNIAASALLYFGVGGLAKYFGLRFSLAPNSILRVFIIGAFVSILLAYAYFGPRALNMSANYFGDRPQDIFLTVVVSMVGAALLYIFSIQPNLPSFFSWLGQRTLPILGFNYFANSLSFRVLGLFPENDFFWIISFFMQIAMLSVLAFLIEKIEVFDNLINGKAKFLEDLYKKY